MRHRWYLDASGKRFWVPAAVGSENTPDDAVAFTTLSNEQHHIDPELEYTLKKVTQCNRCGVCCGHPASECPDISKCWHTQRLSAWPDYHWCPELSTAPPTGSGLGSAGKGSCQIWQTMLYDGPKTGGGSMKGCLLWPNAQEEIDDYFWVSGYCVITFET